MGHNISNNINNPGGYDHHNQLTSAKASRDNTFWGCIWNGIKRHQDAIAQVIVVIIKWVQPDGLSPSIA